LVSKDIILLVKDLQIFNIQQHISTDQQMTLDEIKKVFAKHSKRIEVLEGYL